MLLEIIDLRMKNRNRETRALLPPRSAGTEKDNDNPTHEKRNDDKDAKFLIRGHVFRSRVCAGKR
jgi:hypothetical protein